MHILTLHCRNYELHFTLYDWERKRMAAWGAVERVVGDSTLTVAVPGRRPARRDRVCRNHIDALSLVLDTLTDRRGGVIDDLGAVRAVAHRVAHGAGRFHGPVVIDGDSLPLIGETLEFAPKLNAPALNGIEAARELLGPLPQVAVFDTDFHRTLPEVAYRYAVPTEWFERYRIRRYGFHGYAHLYAARRGAALLGRPPEECTLVTVHVGEGASLCLVRGGVSVDTSMGLSMLEGVMMDSACGDIDAGIIPFIIQEEGLTPQEVEAILGMNSGSMGIAGHPLNGPGAKKEFRRSPRGRLALEMEGYRLRKYLGAYLAVGNPDAIVFSYAEGWADWPARGAALKELRQFGVRLDAAAEKAACGGGGEVVVSAHDSRIPVLVVPSGEDVLVNGEVARVLGWPS